MKLRKAERESIATLLEQGAESAEELAQLVADALDDMRGGRSHSFACMIVAGVPVAVGPYSTKGQAEKAVTKLHADKAWVVGGWTAEGFVQHLGDVDKEVEKFSINAKEEAARQKAFWGKVSRIRDGDATAITGNVEIRPLKLPKGTWG